MWWSSSSSRSPLVASWWCLPLIWPKKNQDFSWIKSHCRTQNFVLSPNLAFLGRPDPFTVMPNFGRERRSAGARGSNCLPTPFSHLSPFYTATSFVSFVKLNTDLYKIKFCFIFCKEQVDWRNMHAGALLAHCISLRNLWSPVWIAFLVHFQLESFKLFDWTLLVQVCKVTPDLKGTLRQIEGGLSACIWYAAYPCKIFTLYSTNNCTRV